MTEKAAPRALVVRVLQCAAFGAVAFQVASIVMGTFVALRPHLAISPANLAMGGAMGAIVGWRLPRPAPTACLFFVVVVVPIAARLVISLSHDYAVTPGITPAVMASERWLYVRAVTLCGLSAAEAAALTSWWIRRRALACKASPRAAAA